MTCFLPVNVGHALCKKGVTSSLLLNVIFVKGIMGHYIYSELMSRYKRVELGGKESKTPVQNSKRPSV